MKVQNLVAREILDSRGNPTVEVELWLADGSHGRAAVPSGASTGTYEALELRDGDPSRYGGKGVTKAVRNVQESIAARLVGASFVDQAALDAILIELDGTDSKHSLGANAILGVSLAFAHAAASAAGVPLYTYVNQLTSVHRELLIPLPLCNIINGGKHAKGSTDIQEFMILPVGARDFRQAVQMSASIFHALRDVLDRAGYTTNVGDEGGFAPSLRRGNREAFEQMARAVDQAGYVLGSDVVLACDVAASELISGSGYHLATEERTLSSTELIAYYAELAHDFPIHSIEDGLGENDWAGWEAMTSQLGQRMQLVGDDLLVTNVKFIQRAIDERAANAVLIKPNQIGTLTETVAAVDLAHRAGWHAILSHRSGETEDTTIAHLAVGLGTGQIKIGSVSRGERTAKYNELIRIEEQLGDRVHFTGASILT